MNQLSASVVIPTYNRSQFIGACLQHLRQQTVTPHEVLVVDASRGDETQEIVRSFPEVTYVRSPHGRGTTATSRAIGVERSSGDLIVCLDDDAYPAMTWLEELMKRYGPPDVAGVGGRTDNGRPHEESEGVGRVGLLLPNGQLTGHFAALTPGDVEVDHLLRANMSIRRDVLEELGGIRDFFPGTCLREESDIALRARAAGYRPIYTPDALGRHVGGMYAGGRRFDLWYEYYGARNHAVLPLTAPHPADPGARAGLGEAARHIREHLRRAGRSVLRRPDGGATPLRGANGTLRAVIHGGGTLVGVARSRRYRRQLQATEGQTWTVG